MFHSASVILTVRNLNPSTETIPAMLPMIIERYGWIAMSAQVPTATPPARVAFWMCTCREPRNMSEVSWTGNVQDWMNGGLRDPRAQYSVEKTKNYFLNEFFKYIITESLSSKQLTWYLSCQGFLGVYEWSETSVGRDMQNKRTCSGRVGSEQSNYPILILPVGAVWEHFRGCHEPTEACGCCVLSEPLLFQYSKREYRDI